jgi:hypothetical protein
MKKGFLILTLIVISATGLMAAESVIGLWRGVDENTGESTMFTYIYEYQGNSTVEWSSHLM